MMIRDLKKWIEREDQYYRDNPVDFRRNLKVYEALFKQAVLLGTLPAENPLEGIEEKFRLATAINVFRDT